MTSHGADLSVRRHERYLCDLPVAIAVEEQGSLRLSKGVLGARGLVTGHAVDISMGGLGVSSRVYLPPSTRIRLELTVEGQGGSRVISLPVQVHRVAMVTRTPSYYLGAAFLNLSKEQEKSVEEVLAQLKSSGAKLVPEKASA